MNTIKYTHFVVPPPVLHRRPREEGRQEYNKVDTTQHSNATWSIDVDWASCWVTGGTLCIVSHLDWGTLGASGIYETQLYSYNVPQMTQVPPLGRHKIYLTSVYMIMPCMECWSGSCSIIGMAKCLAWKHSNCKHIRRETRYLYSPFVSGHPTKCVCNPHRAVLFAVPYQRHPLALFVWAQSTPCMPLLQSFSAWPSLVPL